MKHGKHALVKRASAKGKSTSILGPFGPTRDRVILIDPHAALIRWVRAQFPTEEP
jgi:hypothetical protein